jgi:tRNA 2-selenouridine synthase
VPDALMREMRAARCLVLEASLETRVALLTEEYRHFLEERALLDAQLQCLAGLHGPARIAEWKSLEAGELVRRLLEEHYDPAYRRSTGRNYLRLGEAEVVNLDAPEEPAFARLARRLLGMQAGKHAHVLHHAAT